MNKNEVHYRDLIKWVHKVIDSCQTREQVKTAERLIDNFSEQPQIKQLDVNLKIVARIPLHVHQVLRWHLVNKALIYWQMQFEINGAC